MQYPLPFSKIAGSIRGRLCEQIKILQVKLQKQLFFKNCHSLNAQESQNGLDSFLTSHPAPQNVTFKGTLKKSVFQNLFQRENFQFFSYVVCRR